MPRDDPPGEVFDWLSEGTGLGPPAYLRLLGPGGGEGGARVLANLEVVAGRLRDRPDYWRSLIRARNWRFTLVGCSAVLLTRDARFLDDLLDRFGQGSWVAPQLTVALGLIHRPEAILEFERTIRRPDLSAGPKHISAAYAALKILGSGAASEFEASDLFRRSRAEGAGTSPASASRVAEGAVRHHWNFWAGRGPR